MKDFLKAPFSNLFAILLCVILAVGTLAGSAAGQAQLAPLTLGGANPGFSNFTGVNVKDGTAAAPSFGFTGETGTGFYRVGASDIGFSLNGSKVADFTAAGVKLATASITRTETLPLTGFVGCTTAIYSIPFSNGADTKPEFILQTSNQGYALDFGVTTQVDTDHVCQTIDVPADYVSGGQIQVRATKSADTGAQEWINCAGSLNNAAILANGAAQTVGAASAQYTCLPTLTGLAAENSLGVSLWITSNTTANDDVIIESASFEYQGVQ